MYTVNHVPLINTTNSTTGCCALIDPEQWDEKTFVFDNKLFAEADSESFMHIPLNLNKVMQMAQEAIDDADAADEEWIILSKEASPWRAEHYFAVTKDVPGLLMKKLSGTYITKVFDGPYKDARIWHEKLTELAKSKGYTSLQTYFFYTTCPECAKTYGHNYVVGFVRVVGNE